MKQDIHPKWFADAVVICACGNSWTTGATQPELKTDICSACHPFYTGEQRIVDTEGQVDRFMKRLQGRDAIRARTEQVEASKTPANLPVEELGLDKRALNVLKDNGINVVQDFFDKLKEGEEAVLELPGIGQKILADVKKLLRNRGYELPETETAE